MCSSMDGCSRFPKPLSCPSKSKRRLDMLPELTDDERDRYDRQMGSGVLSDEGQRRLKAASALVTRVGGLGGPAALSLVAAGVGTVIIAHGGELESPDLNRQILGSESGIGKPRAMQFAQTLRSMNRFVNVEVIDHEPDRSEERRVGKECRSRLAPYHSK